jgi:hypothetical protein
LLISCLPFLGPKYLGLWLGATALLIWRLRGAWKKLGAALAVLLIGGACYLAVNYALYGSASPLAVYGWERDSDSAAPPANKSADYYRGGLLAQAPRSLALAVGYLVDQKVGLLFYAPFYLLALPGLILLWRRDRGSAAALIALVLPYLFLVFLHANWDGRSPPVRHLVTVVPLLLMLSAIGASSLRGRSAALVAGAGIGWALTFSGYAMLREPWLLNRSNWAFPQERGNLLLELSSTRVDLARYAPNLTDPAAGWGVTASWLVAAAAAAGILVLGSSLGAAECKRFAWPLPLAAGATILLLVVIGRYASCAGQLLGPCAKPATERWCLEIDGGWAAGPNGFWIKPERWVALRRDRPASGQPIQVSLFSPTQNRVELVGAESTAVELSRLAKEVRIAVGRRCGYDVVWVRVAGGTVPFLSGQRQDSRYLGVRLSFTSP